MRILIDPGHGGWDSGAVGPSSVREADITLAVALRLAAYLRAAGAEVRLTRETDIALGNTLNEDLLARVAIANSWPADLVISIHCNSGVKITAHGMEVWTSNGDTYSDDFADFIGKELQAAFPEFTFRADMTDGDLDKEENFCVLWRTKMPAVLVELLFISNPGEEAILSSAAYQDKAALALCRATCDYTGLPMPGKGGKVVTEISVANIKANGKMVKAVNIDGKTFCPVRELAEALGKKVTWDDKTQSVVID